MNISFMASGIGSIWKLHVAYGATGLWSPCYRTICILLTVQRIIHLAIGVDIAIAIAIAIVGVLLLFWIKNTINHNLNLAKMALN